jgi:hypothetical protein
MPTFDAHRNFALGAVATPPNPASSGASMILSAGQGALMPAPPFNLIVFPAGNAPSVTNAEIVRVTNVVNDTLTIARTQEGTPARTIIASDVVMAGITAKTLTDVERAISIGGSGTLTFAANAGTATVTVSHNRGQPGYAVSATATGALPAGTTDLVLTVLNKTPSTFDVQGLLSPSAKGSGASVTFDWTLTGP